MGDHYDEFREQDYAMSNKNKTTSPGLADLLRRNGVKPTGDSDKDLKLAKRFMPKSYR